MIAERLLTQRHRFREVAIPKDLTHSQLSARRLFLEKIHNQNSYIKLNSCPYCGARSFTKISEIERRGLPCSVVICYSCDGCFGLTVLNDQANRYHYENVSYLLRGKEIEDDKLDKLFWERVEHLAYGRYNFISAFSNFNPGEDLIVELGCNDGANLYPWQEAGFETIGVELNPRLAEFAKEKGIKVLRGDLMECDFGKSKPKLIILTHVLEHVRDISATLKKLSGILDSQGCIFIESPGIRVQGTGNSLEYFDIEHNYNFDLKSLTGLIKKYGFKIIYADEFIRLLCTPKNNPLNPEPKIRLFSLNKIKSGFFRCLSNMLSNKNEQLYDLLRAGERRSLKTRLYNRAQRGYLTSLFKMLQKGESHTHLAKRYIEEDLEKHWQVDESKESFKRLLDHLERKTNFKPYFEEAIEDLGLANHSFKDGQVIADIGAGVSWTSALLAKYPNVGLVYAVDPSLNRLRHAEYVIKHFGVKDKVRIVQGSFLEPKIREKVDLVVLCGSLHHCLDEQLEGLFLNLKGILKKGGRILVCNEHYVDGVWMLKRLLSYFKDSLNRKKPYYRPFGNLRAPDPFSCEHWRKRSELEQLFKGHGFRAQFFIHQGDLCKDKPSLYHRLGWRYYHAILTLAGEAK